MSEQEVKTGRKRRGRPPGPTDSTRPHRVVTFVTGSELQQVGELAEGSGKSLSSVVHDLLVFALEHPNQPYLDGQ